MGTKTGQIVPNGKPGARNGCPNNDNATGERQDKSIQVMKPVVERMIIITVTVVFVFFSIAYFCNQEWARLPWCILLFVISLYNLLRNRKNIEKE